MGLNQILGLKFKANKHQSRTIHSWIDGSFVPPKPGVVRRQLQSYVAGLTVQKEIVDKNFRGFVAVIVGSRKILLREMDRHGNWVNEFQLCDESY